MIDLEACLDRFFAVVVALNQIFTGHIVFARDFRWIELHVIRAARRLVHAATAHARDDHFVRHRNFKREINSNARVLHRFGLWDRARKTVKQIAVLAIGLRQALFHQTDDDFVAHERAGIHHFFRCEPHRGAGLDRCAQHVARGNLRYAVFLANELRLCAFARPRGTKKNESHVIALSG